MTRLGIGDPKLRRWDEWLRSLRTLGTLNLPGCVRSLGNIDGGTQLLTFCDASGVSYGAVTYVTVISMASFPYLKLLIPKSTVAPLKMVTIPGLGLAAAGIAVRLCRTLS